MPTATLNFSRNAAQIAVQYYMMLRCGFDGYKEIMSHAVTNAALLTKRLVESGYFKTMTDTPRIPVVALTLNKSKSPNFNEFDISAKVRERGWVISAYSMPANAQTINSLRIVVRPHLNITTIHILADDIIKACQFLEKNGGNMPAPALHISYHATAAKC